MRKIHIITIICNQNVEGHRSRLKSKEILKEYVKNCMCIKGVNTKMIFDRGEWNRITCRGYLI